jgi:hypothetical protein
MTSSTSPLLRTVDEMLIDAGETDPRLRATLLSLGALASLPVPEPRAELAALLSAPTSQLARHRLRGRHRTAAVSLAVIAGMGLGVTGVAATASAPSANARGSVQHLLQDWAPSWTIAGTPGVLPWTPAAAEPGSPDASVPAGPAAADAGTAGPETDAPGSATQDNVPGRSQNPGPGAASPGKPAADGGASRNGAGGTKGRGASQDGTARGDREPGTAPGGDPAGQLEKAGKLVTEAPAVVGNLTSAILAPITTDPATTEKTGAGNTGPGSIWLKKFSR